MKKMTHAIWKLDREKLYESLSEDDRLVLDLASKPKTSFLMSTFVQYSDSQDYSGSGRVFLADSVFWVLFCNCLITNGHSNFLPATAGDEAVFPVFKCGNFAASGQNKVCSKIMDEGLVHAASGCVFVRYHGHNVLEA